MGKISPKKVLLITVVFVTEREKLAKLRDGLQNKNI